MTRRLRQGDGKHGLVLANGGVITYQYALCLSTHPRKDGSPYPSKNPLPDIITNIPVPPVTDQAEGDAVIEVRIIATPYSKDANCFTDIHSRIQPRWNPAERPCSRPTEGEWASVPCQSWRFKYTPTAMQYDRGAYWTIWIRWP